MADEELRTYADGLLRKCKACATARKKVEEMNVALRGRMIIGTQPDEEGDPDLKKDNVMTYGPWRLDCLDCKNTGFVLTAKGRKLLGLLLVWWEEARPAWATISEEEVERDNEIPF